MPERSKTPRVGSRLLLAAGLTIFIAAFFLLGFHKYLTLEHLKEKQAEFQTYYAANPFTALALFIALYTVVTGTLLPGATVLTLTGGALFGFWVGVAAVAVGATFGATVAFLISRYLLRDFVQSHFKERLRTVNEGVERDGHFYLLSMRLIPAFPFFVVNLTMALTPIRLLPYVFVSFFGMLPASAVYVNAGTQLAKIEKIEGLVSPPMLAAFALLAALPFALKFLIQRLKG